MPGFTAVALLTLALGIGANTAIFQLLDAVRLRRLPVAQPERLVEVRIAGGNRGHWLNPGPYGQLTRPIWNELRSRQHALSGLFAWSTGGLHVGPSNDLRMVRRLSVTGDTFAVLGVSPWQGRLLIPDDEAAACPPRVAVVSHGYWQREMGARPLTAESRLLLGGELAVAVVGVTPPWFFGLAVGESFDVALPLCRPERLRNDLFDLSVMGRPRPGLTVDQASASLAALSGEIFAATVPAGYSPENDREYRGFRLAAYPAAAGVSQLRTSYETSLWLLLAITGLVLLIACANLANLMLTRVSARQHELAVRLALGASRRRLFQQLMVESALLAGAGAALGVGLARLLTELLLWSLSTERAPVDLRLASDWRVLLFTTATATLTCLAFGAVPALRASGGEPARALNSSGPRATGGRDRLALQRLLVVGQVAVCLVLLFGALLFIGSFRNLMTFDPGMRQQGITLASLWLGKVKASPEGQPELHQRLLEEIRALPGVLGADSTTNPPLVGSNWGHRLWAGGTKGESRFAWVTPGYLRTMAIPLLAGRPLEESDTRASRRVALVNQTFARTFLAGTDPIGQTLRTSPEPNYPSTVYEIVGVFADTRYSDLRAPILPIVLAPASQFPPTDRPELAVLIHSQAPPGTVIETVRRHLAQSHPEVVVRMSDFQRTIRDRLVQERSMAALSGFFGLVALLLATVGCYGVTAYLVARRRKEFGIRLALGARPVQILSMVVRDSVRLLAVGLAAGGALALLMAGAARTLLFGITPHDAGTLVAACVLVAATVVVASTVPARRAMRLNPMTTLREE
jgi:predicted permease